MPRKVRIFVAFTVAAALVMGAVLFATQPAATMGDVRAVIVLGLLALVADFLSHSMLGGASGSISFLPCVAMLVLVPGWPSVIAVGMASGAGSLVRGSSPIKSIFNFAQTGLAAGVAALVFTSIGGRSLLGPLAAKTGFSWYVLGPIFVASMVYLVLNTALVASVMGLNEKNPILPIWTKMVKRTLVYDAVASPVVYLLAWMYAQFGVTGAVVFSAPLFVLREVYKTNRLLERVNQELLELMVKAIEARDPYTSGHSRRVSQYSKIIARAVGIGGSELERIGIVALLHDVGKIHEIYAPILRKPEKLSPAEWAVMQTHPIKSSELVATVSHLKDIVAPVRHHHENWDGTGYPDGLQGEQIPLGARIVLFADTIDAMTTDRPYRKALSEAQVRSELVKFRGKQFDPEICDKLLASPMFGLLFAPHAREATPEHTSPITNERAGRLAVRGLP